MAVEEVTDATFEQQVLHSEQPVLIDLYADWCGPCKQLSPIVEDVARDLQGQLRVCKVDVDANPGVAQAFRVQSIPMLVLIHEGRVADHKMGLVDKATIMKMVEPVLSGGGAQITPEQLAQLLAAGRAVPVDVRDASAYGRAHIPGAVHVPADRVAEEASTLASGDGKLRVLYARTEDDARNAVQQLAERGVEAGYLAGGFLAWESDGGQVERG